MRTAQTKAVTHTDVADARTSAAICVQNLDDSLCFAFRITYRALLRSSSSREPRHPLGQVVSLLLFGARWSSLLFVCCSGRVSRSRGWLVLGRAR